MSTIQARYSNQSYLGSGAYGRVSNVRDTDDGNREVIFKTIPDAFNVEQPIISRFVFNETAILHASTHPNIIRLRDASLSENGDVHMVLDKMDTSLERVLMTHLLTETQQQYVLYQLVSAVHYLHSGCILHRDIKPGNILIDETCHVRLCDFGISIGVHPTTDTNAYSNPPGYRLMKGFGTPIYFAPEQLLYSAHYGTPVDVWAIGCIMGEMFDGKRVFMATNTKGDRDEPRHWHDMLQTQGRPLSEDDIADLQPRHPHLMTVHATLASSASSSAPTAPSMVSTHFWAKRYPRASPLALDLLRRMLHVNPRERITTGEILGHPYLAAFHDAKRVRVCTHSILNVDDFGDRNDLNSLAFRQKFIDLITDMHQTNGRPRNQQYGYAYVPSDQITSVLSLGYLSVREQVNRLPQNIDAIRRRYATQYEAAKVNYAETIVTFESEQVSPPHIDSILKYLDWRTDTPNGSNAIYFLFAPIPHDNDIRARIHKQRDSFLDGRVLIRFPVPREVQLVSVPPGVTGPFINRDETFWVQLWRSSLEKHASALWFQDIPHGYFVPAHGRIDPSTIELVS